VEDPEPFSFFVNREDRLVFLFFSFFPLSLLKSRTQSATARLPPPASLWAVFFLEGPGKTLPAVFVSFSFPSRREEEWGPYYRA